MEKASRLQNLGLVLAGVLVLGAVVLTVWGFGQFGLVLLVLALVLGLPHFKITRR